MVFTFTCSVISQKALLLQEEFSILSPFRSSLSCFASFSLFFKLFQYFNNKGVLLVSIVLPSFKSLLCNVSSELLVLVKPQFEVGKGRVSKGGVVRQAKYHIEAIESVINAAEEFQWKIKGLIASPLTGPAGNHEYLAWMTKSGVSSPIINTIFIENLVKETL